jgi:hypothetical protein
LKTLRAFLIAPLAAPVWFWIQAMVTALLDPQFRGGTLTGAGQALVIVMAFGTPIAYLTALLAVGPALWWLRQHTGGTAAFGCAVIGVTLGAAVAKVIEPSLRGELFSIPLSPIVGAECGAAAAVVFWLLARRPAAPSEISEQTR